MGALAMKKDDTIDHAEVISTRKLEGIVKQHAKHAAVVLYDDVAQKELQEKTISRRVRNASDKAVWDVITGDREWAWKVIVATCIMLGTGVGFRVSDPSRVVSGFNGDVEAGALWLALISEWRELADKRGLNADMCVDVLWQGLGFRAAEQKHKCRNGSARQNLADCLDLLVEMRDTAPLKAWKRKWLKGAQARAAAAGIQREGVKS